MKGHSAQNVIMRYVVGNQYEGTSIVFNMSL